MKAPSPESKHAGVGDTDGELLGVFVVVTVVVSSVTTAVGDFLLLLELR